MAKKYGLGKGLEALMGEANAESGAAPTNSIAISQIVRNKNQPRRDFDEEELNELADSIRQHGVLQPILVRPKEGKFEIVAGERRYRASKQAGLEEIPAIVREISDQDVFRLALIENLQRSDLNPLEEARGMQKLLKDEGMTQAQLAEVLSKSRSSIANTLRLLDLPEEVQSYLVDGRITPGHARAILAVPSEEGRKSLAERVVKENLTVRQTENLASLFSVKESEPKTREPNPAYFRTAARQLRVALNTPVKVRKVRNRNKIEIEFTDEEQLNEIVARISVLMEGDEADA